MQPDREWAKEEFDKLYIVPSEFQRNDDFAINPLPVSAKITIYLNDRPIYSSSGIMVKIWEHDEDVRNLHVIKFPIVTTPMDTFKRSESGNDRIKNHDTNNLNTLCWIFLVLSALGIVGYTISLITNKANPADGKKRRR